jgi:hypothetical protein
LYVGAQHRCALLSNQNITDIEFGETLMAVKKPTKDEKKLSKGQRKHVRRQKAAARKAATG